MTTYLLVIFLISAGYCAVASLLFRAVFQRVRERAETEDYALAVMLEVEPVRVMTIFALICFFWPATILLAVGKAWRDEARERR